MAASKIFPLRLPDETKARWQTAAEKSHGAGGSLAEFIKAAVEEKIARSPTPHEAALDALGIDPAKHARTVERLTTEQRGSATTTSTGKIFKGPDPKPSSTKKK